MNILYSNRFLRRAQEWWRRKKREKEFLNHKEILEEILREFTITRKKYPSSRYLTITLPKEAVSHLEDFVKSSLYKLKIKEFIRSLPNARVR